MELRTSSLASIMFFLKLKMITNCAWLSLALERISYTPVTLCSVFSMRLTTSRSTVSGDAPGYGIVTTSTGCCTSGISLTRSLVSASTPAAINAMIRTTVPTGRRIEKSDRNMRGSLRRLGRLRGRDGRRGGCAGLDGLAVLERGDRGAQQP